MSGPATRIWLVEAVSVLRIVGAISFAAVAFQRVPVVVIASLYGVAMGSDVIDGYLARRLGSETYFGRVLDLVSDKSLTIVSLLYAAARGASFLPLTLIAIREILMIGARLIRVDNVTLFPTSRALGGSVALVLWGNTLVLVLDVAGEHAISRASITYWACAVVLNANLVWRVWSRASVIKASLTEGT
jgi:phosphatidylglycerophosphate synthase